MSLSPVARYVAPFALALAIACGGESTGPSASPAIRAVIDTVRPGALLAVRLENATTTQDSVAGLLGGQAVTLFRVDATTLALVTPDVSAGAQSLRVDLAGGSLTTSVTVLAALAFADAEAAIGTTLDAQATALSALAPSGIDPTAWAGDRAKLDSLIAEAKAVVDSLSPTEQLQLARLLASLQVAPEPGALALDVAAFTGGPPPFAPASLNWRDVTCRNTLRRMTKAGIAAGISGYGLGVFLTAPIPNPLLKYGGALVAAAAYTASGLAAFQEWAQAAVDCQVQKSTDLSDTEASNAIAANSTAAPVATADAVAAPRFFQGRPRTFYPVGEFRKLSKDEIAKDAVIASVADLIDDLHRLATSLAAKLPDAIARRLPPLPSRLSQTVAGAFSLQAVPSAGVRIENVRPSSVQLTSNAAGELAIQLRTGAAVTTDVPFTFDVVSTYDSKVRITRAGVARPLMSGVALPYPATITGTRTITTVNNVQYGTLTCGGAVTVRISGGDRAEWEDFSWVQTGPSTNSAVEPIRGAGGTKVSFEAGDHPFNGSWYWTWSENGVPMYKSFSVAITITYTDLVTNTVKSVPITFNCV